MLHMIFLECLSVPLIHRQKEKRQHQPNHEQNCCFIPNMGAGKQVRWHANKSRNRKANELSPRQIKSHLGFALNLLEPIQRAFSSLLISFLLWVEQFFFCGMGAAASEDKIPIFAADLLSFIFLVIHNIFLS